jgi:RNA polymerase sigma factor (sigma-70 family)
VLGTDATVGRVRPLRAREPVGPSTHLTLTSRRRANRPLLRQARDDAQAFGAFYEANAERVLLFITRRVLSAETALDLMSETFAIAFEQRREFRGSTVEEERAWLYAIARSQISLFVRRGEIERAALGRLGVAVPSLSDAELERIEELAELRQIAVGLEDGLQRLPGDRRAAVELRVVEELGYAEVATRLQTTQDNARALVSRGLRQLARELQAEGDGR